MSKHLPIVIVRYAPIHRAILHFGGERHSADREPRDALVDIERAIEINSNDPDHHFVRGYVLQLLKNYTKAIAAYTKAISLRIKEDKGRAYYNRGLCHKALGRAGEAEQDFEHARRLGIRK